MTDSVRSFDQTRRLARQVGDALTLIEERLPYRTAGKAKKLKAVAEAMTLIADTPNASLGRVTMQQFDRIVDEGVKVLHAWVADVLNVNDPDVTPDGIEIPF